VDFKRTDIQNLEGIGDFIADQGGNWEDPPADQTYENVSGSALKSTRQRLYSVADPAGLDTSLLPPGAAVLPHSVGPVSAALPFDALDPAFPA
jgi:hypothetical protein